jgi:hypothetical protein
MRYSSSIKSSSANNPAPSKIERSSNTSISEPAWRNTERYNPLIIKASSCIPIKTQKPSDKTRN